MKIVLFGVAMLSLTVPAAIADPLTCDLSNYKALAGLKASIEQDTLVVLWNGEAGNELRARYAIDRGTPVIQELAIRKTSGQWGILGTNLSPEYQVISGRRRVSNQQLQRPRERGLEITKEFMEREAWYAFWDAPMVVPGIQQGRAPTNPDLPRRPEEIRRATSTFSSTRCDVKTDGARVEVDFPGLSMGIFAGSVRFTMYPGTNLIRLEAIAKTDENLVAYKYNAALKGFGTAATPQVTWHDTGGNVQRYQFGGVRNDDPVTIRAKNRILTAEGRAGSVAVFPPPTKFFFNRELDTNLGYVWYRKDAADRYAIGVKQADREDEPRYLANYALYNAPPGTWQRMAVYFYASPDAAQPTREKVLAFTHGDAFAPIPGYKTLVQDFHLGAVDRQRATGSFDTELPDFAAMKAIGVNIVGISEFHGDTLRSDTGLGRFEDQKLVFDFVRRASDNNFLVVPWELSMDSLGSDWNVVFPKRVYWSKKRDPGQPFSETHSQFGTVYHLGGAEDVLKLVTAENGLWITGHPRTKTSTGFPDAYKDDPVAKSDGYLGLTFQIGMGMDLSTSRLCEYRCFETLDMLNNLYAGSGLQPKQFVVGPDTYQKWPHDDLYPGFQVNYLKLDRLPGPDEDWQSVIKALRSGDHFVTTGEILLPSYAVTGTGDQRTITADVRWTFPLEFVEVVWGDGQKVDRQVIRATDLPPFGIKTFSIPFNAAGKQWVRFAAWDSAGNGAFAQPVWLHAARAPAGGKQQ